ncbi:MAG: exodeoxyribonuclease V subunit beta [Deltaproteobacteria bacterium]|nr:exodeoxyribonuclease V subunit beta [Deltaproteobacteria bacterium]
MIPFDLPASPLQGAHLIEASAGTGKTYTIAGLYVRLIIERAIPVREILVVTFTLAATAELKDRIRRKLRETLEAFTGEESKDEFLQALVRACPDPAARREACERLRAALRDFDEAAIFTIHSFCQRMLHEHAFESGALFDTELVTDQRRLKEEIIQDFWRTHFYEALPELVGYALNQGFSPASFLSWTGNIALNPDIRVLPDGEPPSLDAFRASLATFHRAVRDLQTLWPAAREDVRQKLQDPALKANIYGAKTANRLVEAMDGWLAAGDFLLFKGFEKMTPAQIAKAVRKNAAAPEHPIFPACAMLLEKAAALRKELDQYLLFLKAELIRTVRTELPVRKQKQNILFFDDLLFRLREALEKEGGGVLAAAIRNKFKAALNDEFQDTDPIQYAIFHALFGREDHILFLIGDPKQAIYSFRGADIFSYMQAATAIETGYTLDQNWRSEPGLIAAVNALFSQADKPFVYEEIPFRPMKAAPIASRNILTLDGKQEPPLEWWFIPAGRFTEGDKPLSKGAAKQRITDAVAAEIARLIQQGRERRALIGQRPLEEGDMAVLVRTNREARLIQQALRALRIASVLTSEESIFDSQVARELIQVLQGIAGHARESLVRGALTTDMLGAGGEALELWLRDDNRWSVRLETFRQDHDLWETRGFMRMFRTLMSREGIRGRLLSFPDGERRLTNLLHLSEILHQESLAQKLNPERLLQWLAEQLSGEGRESRDEHLLRLESDAHAVKILTIHKSKGLEYPVVFCPFAWGPSRITGESFSFHDESRNRELTLDLGSADQGLHRPAAERELLAENCRLLYVALTRAKHRCYFVWGRINKTDSSAPAYLFHRDQADIEACGRDDLCGALEKRMATLSDQDMQADLARIAAKSGGTIRLQELPAAPGIALPPRPEPSETSVCRKFKGRIDTSWKVASYTLLISGPSPLAELPDRDAITSPASARTTEFPLQLPPLPRREASDDRWTERNIFTFPGGARAGILFHDILEQFDFTERNLDVIRRLVAEKLQTYGFDPHWEETLSGMLQNVAACPLPLLAASGTDRTPTLALSQISTSARLTELEFYFPLQMLSREKLSATFGKGDLKETGLERLNFNPVRGFMHGFIDLVFQHEGRFYLVDWKSNLLGPGIADYAPTSLRKAMTEHFYVLQSRLYAVALHQYLTLRLPDYQYENHFGGIYYLFIRGMDPACGPAYGVYGDRPAATLINTLSSVLIDKTPQKTP